MALSDKIALLNQELTQRQKAMQARALLQNLQMTVLDTNRGIQEIADSDDFDTLDTEIKTVLVAAWDISKAAQTALEDASIVELLDWRP